MNSEQRRGRVSVRTLIIIAIIAILVGWFLFGGSGSPADYETPDVISAGNGVQTGWTEENNSGADVVTTVSDEARDPFTTIQGDGKDTVTVMVYMCGTDLESKSAMGTNDLNEMLSANIADNVNVLVYTGGCNRWRNNLISSSVNQIYKVSAGDIECVVDNDGRKAMTDPNTLAGFIKYCKKNYPANRNELILWDHGTGSVAGYGYDEKYANSGSMSLSGIDRALDAGGVKFDFVGFDACLMATAETATMLGDHADYMVASEETEPGIGWYYTDWLNAISKNTSMPTVELGKSIVDSFVKTCEKDTPGQQATLSVVDLTELSQTLPDKMSAFSTGMTELIGNGGYQQVSQARSMSKEFASGNKLDQVDLVHFASLLRTEESKALAETLLSAVKYNKTSRRVSNAYGLSIYFPYSSFGYVNSAANIYSSIGMNMDYARAIQNFAQMQASGQAVSGGGSSELWSLFGGSQSSGYTGSGESAYYTMDAEDMMTLVEALLGGRYKSVDKLKLEGLTKDNMAFLSRDALDAETVIDTVSKGRITDDDLKWVKGDDGKILKLREEQWKNVSKLDMAMFYDDGEGYIDLGRDNLYDFDEEGNLKPEIAHDWLAINGQPVAYYHTETYDVSDDEYSIFGYVPVLLNGDRAKLLLVFDNENEDGYVAGVTYDYEDTDAEAKAMSGLRKGDKIDFLAGYYSYDGEFRDNYRIGEQMTVENPKDIKISNVDVGKGDVMIGYCLTDIYGQEFWTDMIRKSK